MRLAVFTVSPNKQYLGNLRPTAPATIGPVCIPVEGWGYEVMGLSYDGSVGVGLGVVRFWALVLALVLVCVWVWV